MASIRGFFRRLLPRSTRGRYIMLGTAGVLMLALVIFGVAALSAPKNDNGLPTIVANDGSGPPPPSASSLYDQAVKAQQSGETTKAKELLKQVIAVDPNNSDAQKHLNEITPDTPAPRFDGDYLKAMPDVGVLLPNAVPGYFLTPVEGKTKAAVLTINPSPQGADFSRVSVAQLTVYDFGSQAEAAKFTNRVGRVAYSKNASTVQIGVIKDAYSGNDGRRLATVAFARGRYGFEVVVTAAPGVRASDVGTIAKTLAAMFSATK